MTGLDHRTSLAPSNPAFGLQDEGSNATKEAPLRFRLKTPVLHFQGVTAHESELLPIVVQGAPDQRLHLEVLVPPLAPFSVAEPPVGSGRRTRDLPGAYLWIRYDARAGMAQDQSEVVIRASCTEREWVIPLFGSGHLVRTSELPHERAVLPS